MGRMDHPSMLNRVNESTMPVKACDSISDHEPHWWCDNSWLAEFSTATHLCGGSPTKVIDINQARSKRYGR